MYAHESIDDKFTERFQEYDDGKEAPSHEQAKCFQLKRTSRKRVETQL